MTTGLGPSPRDVDCPPAPQGCAAAAGEPCLSHGGTRERHNFHQARTAAWEAARIAEIPAVKLVADAVAEKRIRHGKHASALLAEHGYAAGAAALDRAVSRRNGHMSAKQTLMFLLDTTEGGEGR